MGLESHKRITEDAVARMLEEAVESSHRKGGKNACISGENISKYTNLAMLWLQVLFYSAFITIIFACANPGSVGIPEIKKAIFPVMTEQYWYFTAYFGMALFINYIVNTMKERQLKILMITIIMVFFYYPLFLYETYLGRSMDTALSGCLLYIYLVPT